MWILRFAFNAEKTLSSEEADCKVALWFEDFSDIPLDQLLAAFTACIRSHTFPTIPTIADVRQHLSKAKENALQVEAEQKWERVLDYAVRQSPDVPDKNPPRMSEKVKNAIRAAGGLSHIRDCNRESLIWSRKRFIESYVQHCQLEQNMFLLPDGPVKEAIAAVAAVKQIPKKI